MSRSDVFWLSNSITGIGGGGCSLDNNPRENSHVDKGVCTSTIWNPQKEDKQPPCPSLGNGLANLQVGTAITVFMSLPPTPMLRSSNMHIPTPLVTQTVFCPLLWNDIAPTLVHLPGSSWKSTLCVLLISAHLPPISGSGTKKGSKKANVQNASHRPTASPSPVRNAESLV